MEISDRFWGDIKESAEKRQIPFIITTSDAWKVFLTQEKRCALTGMKLDFSCFGYRGTASLDRVDSSMPYVRHNIQWVFSPINIMKGCHNQHYFKHLCKLVTENGSVTD
jgi:hypothetical protein